MQGIACPGPSLCAFLYWLNSNLSSSFDCLLNGEPQISPPLSSYLLTPPALLASLKVKTRCYHTSSGWKYCEWFWHLCLIRPNPGQFCLHWDVFPSGHPKEIDYTTRSMEELMSHRMYLYQWNIEDGKELTFKYLFFHLTNCSKYAMVPYDISRVVPHDQVTSHAFFRSSSQLSNIPPYVCFLFFPAHFSSYLPFAHPRLLDLWSCLLENLDWETKQGSSTPKFLFTE